MFAFLARFFARPQRDTVVPFTGRESPVLFISRSNNVRSDSPPCYQANAPTRSSPPSYASLFGNDDDDDASHFPVELSHEQTNPAENERTSIAIHVCIERHQEITLITGTPSPSSFISRFQSYLAPRNPAFTIIPDFCISLEGQLPRIFSRNAVPISFNETNSYEEEYLRVYGVQTAVTSVLDSSDNIHQLTLVNLHNRNTWCRRYVALWTRSVVNGVAEVLVMGIDISGNLLPRHHPFLPAFILRIPFRRCRVPYHPDHAAQALDEMRATKTDLHNGCRHSVYA